MAFALAAALLFTAAGSPELECRVDVPSLVRGARAVDEFTLRSRASDIGASPEAVSGLVAWMVDPDVEPAFRVDALHVMAALQHVELRGYPPAAWSRRTVAEELPWRMVDEMPRGLAAAAASTRDLARAISASFLEAALAERDADVRAVAASLAAGYDQDSSPLRAALRRAALEDAPAIHVRAARALQRRGERLAPSTRNALLHDMSRPERWIRDAARDALRAESRRDARLEPLLAAAAER